MPQFSVCLQVSRISKELILGLSKVSSAVQVATVVAKIRTMLTRCSVRQIEGLGQQCANDLRLESL